MSERMWEAREEGERREVRGWDSVEELKRICEEFDFKVGNGFTWNYWDEKNKLYKVLNIGRVWVNFRCVFRAYELYNLKAPTKSGKVLTEKEDVANELVREGFMERCTQQLVHQFCQTAQRSIARLKGLKYELYLKNRLKNEVIVGLFDKKKIKEVIHFWRARTIVWEGELAETIQLPDIIVQYVNGDIDIVSCKCFNRTSNTTAIQRDRSDVGPEKNIFQKLHNNEEIKLPHGIILGKNKNIKVRLVIMLQSTHKQTPYEVYKAYNAPEELPRNLSFSRKKIREGTLKVAKWVKRTKK